MQYELQKQQNRTMERFKFHLFIFWSSAYMRNKHLCLEVMQNAYLSTFY